MTTEKGYFISLNVNVAISFSVYVFLLMTGYTTLIMDVRSIVLFSIAGFFSGFLGRMFNYHSQKMIGITRGSVIKLLSPIFAVILGILFLDEIMNGIDLISIAAILFGMLIVNVYSAPQQARPEISSASEPQINETAIFKKSKYFNIIESHKYAFGLFVGVSCALSYAIGNYFRKSAMMEWSDPVAGACIGVSMALLIFIMIRLFPRKQTKIYYQSFREKGSRFFIWVGVCNILAQFSFFGSLLFLGLSIANVLSLSEPLFTIALVSIFLRNKEIFNAKLILGALVVVVGLIVLILN